MHIIPLPTSISSESLEVVNILFFSVVVTLLNSSSLVVNATTVASVEVGSSNEVSVVVDIKRVLFVAASSLVSSWDIVVSSVSSLAVVVSLVSSHMFPLHCHLPAVVGVITVVVEVVVVVVLVEVEAVFGLGLILKEVGLVLFFLVDVTPRNIFLNVIIKLHFSHP